MAPASRALGSHCAATLFAGDFPLFALVDGTIHRWAGTDRSARAHSALLAAAATADFGGLLTSGEDGRVCRTDGSGEPMELAAVPRKWISCVASSPCGPVAFAAGRSVWLRDTSGSLRVLQHSRSVSGIAFSPDGLRIAVASYGGVTIHSVVGDTPPLELEWKGIYAGLAFSPDGRFLLAFMQEELLHGWRLEDARHFRMTGYPARIKDWAWGTGGRWLATSGATSAIVWRFDGPDGPLGTTALEIGAPRGEVPVTAVACRPQRAELAIGYANGALAVASIDDGEERLVRPAGGGAVTTVAWHNSGLRLAFGSERGECGVLDVPQ